ncbi:MAG TPA: dephospho-CoA kinase [Candidatus Eremiobacteraceae bacterium]|nr:dephospho-CoA kinase [Candidatus Eremiobacteraceae bacterium]
MIVGLTGGIGAGKSSVAKLLEKRGATIIDTDVIAREVVEPPSPVLDEIAREFGASVIGRGGALDREALARIVFNDESRRQRLNEITHPEILKRVLARIGSYPPSAVVVVVVPLLFESGFDRNCNAVIAVTAPEPARIARVMRRDHMAEAEVRARMRVQLPESGYDGKATWIIRNDGDEIALDAEVEKVWAELAKASGRAG